jgi:CHAT domain
MPQVSTILMLAANPKGTSSLHLDREAREIIEALQRAKHRDCFLFEQRWAVRPKDLQRALLNVNPRIVHFSGHGFGVTKYEATLEEPSRKLVSADNISTQTVVEGLAFEDESGNLKLVGTDALASLFALVAKNVECVLLNACYSHVQADAIAQHIPYVIGMNQAIGDEAAIVFATNFYEALGSGESIDQAYKHGCVAIQLEGIPEHLTPILKAGPPSSHPIMVAEVSKPDQQTSSNIQVGKYNINIGQADGLRIGDHIGE